MLGIIHQYIVTRLQGGYVRQRQMLFSILQCPDLIVRLIQPTQWVPGAVSRYVKQLGHKADHSPTSSAQVIKTWTYTSAPTCLHGMGLKHRDNLNMSACTGIWETQTTFWSESLKERYCFKDIGTDKWIILK
jgi:hypothetical protein